MIRSRVHQSNRVVAKRSRKTSIDSKRFLLAATRIWVKKDENGIKKITVHI